MKEELKVPKLKFKEFSGEWEEKELGEIAEFKQGYQIPFSEQIKELEEGYMRYLYIQDFFTDRNILYVKKLDVMNLINKEDIVIANTGNTAGSFYRGKEGILSNNMFVIKIIRKITSDFLFVFLSTDLYQNQLKTFFNLGGQPHLGHKNISKIKIVFPSLPEQQKIADFLSVVDEKIEKLTKKKELLEGYKKGVMQKIFSQELRFKADNGNDFPEWRKGKIKDFGYFYYGKGIPKTETFSFGTTPCVRYGELYSTYKEEIKEIKSFTNIDKENIVLSVGGELLVPRVGEKPLDFSKCSFLPFSGVGIGEMISVYNTKENGLYLSFYFNNSLKYEFAKLVEGGNVSNLYYSYVENVKIMIPSIEEQEKITNFLQSLTNKIELLNKELGQVQEFKKGLLQQMFV